MAGAIGAVVLLLLVRLVRRGTGWGRRVRTNMSDNISKEASEVHRILHGAQGLPPAEIAEARASYNREPLPPAHAKGCRVVLGALDDATFRHVHGAPVD